jgi:hypothetical protein
VKWGSTPREVVQGGIDLLREAGCFDGERASHPCAVLTQVDLDQHALYCYGDAGEYYTRYHQQRGGSINYDRYRLQSSKNEDPLKVDADSSQAESPLT